MVSPNLRLDPVLLYWPSQLTRSSALRAGDELLRQSRLLVLGGVAEAKVAIAEGGRALLARHGLRDVRIQRVAETAAAAAAGARGVVLLLLLPMVLPMVLLPMVRRRWRVVLGRAAADLQRRRLHRVAVVRPLAVGDAVRRGATRGPPARTWRGRDRAMFILFGIYNVPRDSI